MKNVKLEKPEFDREKNLKVLKQLYSEAIDKQNFKGAAVLLNHIKAQELKLYL